MRPFVAGHLPQVLAARARRARSTRSQHPIIREALQAARLPDAAARDHHAGRHPGRHRSRLVGQLHDRAAEGALRAPQAPAAPERAGRAGLRHRDRPARRAGRQAGPVHRRLRRPHLLHVPPGRQRRRRAAARSPMDALFNLEDNLLLFFTGFSRSAGSILTDQKTRSETHDAEHAGEPALRQGARPAQSRDALEQGRHRRASAR